jgi:hypothetical protein
MKRASNFYTKATQCAVWTVLEYRGDCPYRATSISITPPQPEFYSGDSNFDAGGLLLVIARTGLVALFVSCHRSQFGRSGTTWSNHPYESVWHELTQWRRFSEYGF